MSSGRYSYAFVSFALLAMLAAPGHPQQHGTNPPMSPLPSAEPSFSNGRNKQPDPNMAAIEQRQAHARNDERQKRLVSDTEKLLALATQLHDDVGKTDKNILSLDVVKRADEIEKLAHNVKERMKG